eukprot:CAMPEP_0194106732 /NCGR_PEP_ID=MMETSP0150-20130528/6710_1 /TAXON_ID=122233 /ORGANISM="Chaetoceros debilis, Strain MM31A-1" /LENGTH=871 /DNA_ID=CAMNT_0038794957 /DNA_START=51 /DNA_END=2666 /DNA_ORIENTATION=-
MSSSSSSQRLSGNSTAASSLSASDLRAKRLAALGQSTSRSANSTAKTTTTTTTQTNTTTRTPTTACKSGSATTAGKSQTPTIKIKAASKKEVPTKIQSADIIKEKSPPQALQVASLAGKDPTKASSTMERNEVSTTSQPLSDSEVIQILPNFQSLMWDPNVTLETDQQRWFDQGIHTFAMANENSNDKGSMAEEETKIDNDLGVGSRQNIDQWGILQTHGGPCGVLAVIQAEMIKSLQIYNIHQDNERQGNVTREDAEKALCEALGLILARCALAPSVDTSSEVATDAETSNSNSNTWSNTTANTSMSTSITDGVKLVQPMYEDEIPSIIEYGSYNAKLKCTHIQAIQDTATTSEYQGTNPPDRKRSKGPDVNANTNGNMKSLQQRQNQTKLQNLAQATAMYLMENDLLKLFKRTGGVILLAMSMIQTRGFDHIKNDMDDPTSHLTANFGHSSQEFINLLLTGQATSNTFDNTITLGGGALKCHGVQSQPSIGYLTQLEALRYCSVGSYYKTPQFPIWVVGSTSHFTVLFGPPTSLEESESDVILQMCRRAFKSCEGAEDNGFIPVSELGAILKKLDVNLEEAGAQTLGASLKMAGSGIILWSDFWKATSRLMTGASLDSVLQTQTDVTSTSSNNEVLALTQFGDSATNARPSSSGQQATNTAAGPSVESDEEMARRLAREWGGVDGGDVSFPLSQGGGSQSHKSDEELARELQAQFEADDGITSVTTNVGTSSTGVQSTFGPMPKYADADAEVAAITSITPRLDTAAAYRGESHTNTTHENIEKLQDNSFPMYHYNSLRGGILTKFNVTRLSEEEAVGMAVALSETSTDSGAFGGGGGTGGDTVDLETVVRTKYPSCKFDWGGKTPPSLH